MHLVNGIANYNKLSEKKMLWLYGVIEKNVLN